MFVKRAINQHRVLATAASCLLFAATFIVIIFSTRSAQAQQPTIQPSVLVSVSVDPPSEYAPGVVIVKLKPTIWLTPKAELAAASVATSTNNTGLAQAMQAIGVVGVEAVFTPVATTAHAARIASADLARIYRLHLAPATNVPTAVDVLRYNDAVEYAEPDYIAHALLIPNDPEWGNQWAPSKINAPVAWDITQGASTTVIALIDSGIDLSHPDLSGRLWQNDDNPGNGFDDDQNGKIDDVNGWNFVQESNNVTDTNAHGTQVAGVVGAASNNGIGVAGLCGQCKLMPVVAIQPNGVANYSTIANAVAYAAANGASVINLSLGGYADSSLLREAIHDAATTAVIVAAAGNDDSAIPFYPAAYPDVIAVAATGQTDEKSIFSNYGPWVDIAAPGAEIRTTTPGGYASPSGTSMAAPFVAGVAGLVKSLHPDSSPILISWQILNTAISIDGINPTYAGQFGHGRLDAGAALAHALQARAQIEGYAVDGQSNERPAPGQNFQLVLTLRNTWMPGASLVGSLTTTDTYATISDHEGAFGDIGPGQTGQNTSDPFVITLQPNTPYNRNIVFSLTLTGANGYTINVPFTLQVRTAVETLGNTQYTQNTIWTNDKTYILNGAIIVGQGVTLTIQPGTVIKSSLGKFIRVDGTLIAQGTEQAPISFTLNATDHMPWGGLRFADTAVSASFDPDGNYTGGSILRYIELSQADTGVNSGTREPYLANSNLHNNNIGLQSNGGSMRIEKNTFSENTKAIWLTGGQPLISGNYFMGNVNETLGSAIYSNGSPQIRGNRFTGNRGYFIYSVGNTLVMHDNRIVENTGGILLTVQSLEIEHNLIANNRVFCMSQPCSATGIAALSLYTQPSNRAGMHNNTIINNSGYGLQLGGSGASSVAIANNNLFGNATYDIYLENGQSGTQNFTVNANNNFWNVDPAAIAGRIHDCTFDENGCGSPSSTVGKVQHDPSLTTPVQDAPAFVRSVTMNPNPVGLNQLGTVTIDFSRPMITNTMPSLSFHDARRGADQVFGNEAKAIAQDVIGRMWFGLDSALTMFDGHKWYTYTAQSGLGSGLISDIYGAANGDVWVSNGLLRHLQGTQWITLDAPSSGDILSISEATNGVMWFGGQTGALSFDESHWQQYTAHNGLSSDFVRKIVRDAEGRMWFMTGLAGLNAPGGLDVLDGTNWLNYTKSTGMPTNFFTALFADSQGRIWAAPGLYPNQQYYMGMFDGANWHFYGPGNTLDGPSCQISNITESTDGTIWMRNCGDLVAYRDGKWTSLTGDGTSYTSIFFDNKDNLWYNAYSPGNTKLAVQWGGLDYPLNSGQWLSPTRYQSTYNFTALIPQGLYTVDNISGVQALDGIEAAIGTDNTFRVDFGLAANPIPPFTPAVKAENNGTLTMLSASWHTDSTDVDQYRYAIGTSASARNVVGWTYLTTTSMIRNDLTLIQGQPYYVSVQAHNKFGLWSATGVSNQVLGGVVTTSPTATPVTPTPIESTPTPTGTISTPIPTSTPSGLTPTPTATTPGGSALTLSSPGSGAPGSRFVIVGSGFPANTQQPVYLTSRNGVVIASGDKLLTTILTDAKGNFALTTNTLATMTPDIYTISVGDSPRLSVQLTIDPEAPLVLPPINGVLIDLPATIESQFLLFLPVIVR